MQGRRGEVGETGREQRETGRERMEAGRKVNVTSGGEERGVFDLTNTDTKTLQLALLLAPTCHCTVPCKRLRAFPAATLHLLKSPARGFVDRIDETQNFT